MKITFEFDRDRTIGKLEKSMRQFIIHGYKWLTTDGEILGHILGVGHFVISGVLYLLIIACHLIYPSTYFQIGVFICVLIVWLQHVFLQVCISVIAETKLTKTHAPSMILFEELFKKLHLEPDLVWRYFIVSETTFVGFFGLELLSKLSVHIFKKYGIDY